MNMDNQTYIELGMVFSIFVLGALAVKFIRYLRLKKTNTELWATVFEGLTHRTMNLDPLKQPEVYIEKKAKKDGQHDESGNDSSAKS
ncbi:MAG: hypothetical protein EOP48_18720 [Sphingobacteriales bacterium]|nr:MAG: hypothetical protein EOP48_18720 [Sphingobacteriales bacterium]